jgi:hypothetical protein
MAGHCGAASYYTKLGETGDWLHQTASSRLPYVQKVLSTFHCIDSFIFG